MDLSVYKIKSDLIEDKKQETMRKNNIIVEENYNTDLNESNMENYNTITLEQEVERIKKEVHDEDPSLEKDLSEGSLYGDEIMSQIVNVT